MHICVCISRQRRNPKDLTTCCSPSNLVISDYHLFTCSNLPPGTVQWTSPDPFQQLLCCLNIISHLQCYFYRPTVSSNIKLSWYTFKNRCHISRIMNLPDSIGRELRCWGFLYEAGIYLNISFEKKDFAHTPNDSRSFWKEVKSYHILRKPIIGSFESKGQKNDQSKYNLHWLKTILANSNMNT